MTEQLIKIIIKLFKHYDLHNPVTTVRGVRRLEGNRLKDAIRRCIYKVAQMNELPLEVYRGLVKSEYQPDILNYQGTIRQSLMRRGFEYIDSTIRDSIKLKSLKYLYH